MSYKIWLENYLRHPLQLGSLFPSSVALSSLIIDHIKPYPSGVILELGAGTGNVTRSMVRKGIPEEKLVLLEKSLELSNFLRKSFPKAEVICADAIDIDTLTCTLGIKEYDNVVSGIPLNLITRDTRKIIFDKSFKLLRQGGSFVQLSFIPICPIPDSVIAAYSAKKIYCGVSLRNVPTGFVWRVEKQEVVTQISN
jgi:phospholipid N-methyltransferase